MLLFVMEHCGDWLVAVDPADGLCEDVSYREDGELVESLLFRDRNCVQE